MLRNLLSTTVATMFLLTGAQAATLTNVEGYVSVSDGGAFHQASAGEALAPGYRIRTSAGSSASVAYENGYVAQVGPEQVSLVLSDPPAPGIPAANAGPSGVEIGSIISSGGLVAAGAAGAAGAFSSSGQASP